jgi:branched-chain amino acid transport system ATP-binding protein
MARVLEVNNLSKRYGGLLAVDDLSFQVDRGDVLGIIGPNGAGKTTAINLISGSVRPDDGRVVFAGEDVTGMPPHILARKGLVRSFQAAVVYKDKTVEENLLRGTFLTIYPGAWHAFLNTSKARAKRAEAEDIVGELLEWLSLTSVAETKAKNLPYGYQKVLGLAITLAARPQLVMVDEPAAGLSNEEVNQIREVINRVNESGVSVVVVDHNVRFMVDICARLIAMHHGAELAQGIPEDVINDSKVIEAYFGGGDEYAEPN